MACLVLLEFVANIVFKRILEVTSPEKVCVFSVRKKGERSVFSIPAGAEIAQGWTALFVRPDAPCFIFCFWSMAILGFVCKPDFSVRKKICKEDSDH